MQVEAKAKDIDQGQLTFFRFQYEISKCCGSCGHEIMLREQLLRQSFSKITGLINILQLIELGTRYFKSNDDIGTDTLLEKYRRYR